MTSLYADAIHTLLGDLCHGAGLRAQQREENIDDTWKALVESGFLNALLPEAAGGVGLSLAEALPVLQAAGYHGLTLPFIDTLLIRAALGIDDSEAEQAIALAQLDASGDSALLLQPALRGVQAVIIASGEETLLRPVTGREGAQVSLGPIQQRFGFAVDKLALGAFIESAWMVGALQRLLEMTVDYANERQQFGRPIGKFQALQQQISVMTGHGHSAVVALSVAAGGARLNEGRLLLDPAHVAAGRVVICEAAQPAADVAHAVHGAIGVTEEYDLQLWTQRLLAGRRSCGSDSYWSRQLGTFCLDGNDRLYATVQEKLAPAF